MRTGALMTCVWPGGIAVLRHIRGLLSQHLSAAWADKAHPCTQPEVFTDRFGFFQ